MGVTYGRRQSCPRLNGKNTIHKESEKEMCGGERYTHKVLLTAAYGQVSTRGTQDAVLFLSLLPHLSFLKKPCMYS